MQKYRVMDLNAAKLWQMACLEHGMVAAATEDPTGWYRLDGAWVRVKFDEWDIFEPTVISPYLVANGVTVRLLPSEVVTFSPETPE